MNTDTGAIYRTEEEISAAKERGEQIAMISERVADAVEIGMEALNRADRRAALYRRNRNRQERE